MTKTNSFTIYNASAGSGKTYTLVRQYLLLLFGSSKIDHYKNILAITFTNKAVEEMKNRIVESLNSFVQPQPSSKAVALINSISEETGKSPEEIRERSRQILKNIIHNYAAFEVSTIDGFTHRVLRTFAKDLGLPLNFEVELNTGEVLQEVVERLINKAGEDQKLTRILINFATSKADDDKSWDISRDLYAIAELLLKEEYRPYLELLKNKSIEDFGQLATRIREEIKKSETTAIQAAATFQTLLDENGLESSDFSGGHCPKFFAKIAEGNLKIALGAGWQQDIADKELYPKRIDSQKKETLDGLQPQIAALFLKAKNAIINLEFLEAVKKNLIPLSLLSAIQNELAEIRKERALVLISDFNEAIGKAVKDQPAPFIYERLGERYKHYFIDEFQDTSQLQWENLIPLVGHALETEHMGEDFGNLTIVGDAKQSIYRWRGGKAEQFMELCTGKNPFSIENKEVIVLPSNYRSARKIVEFNNNFFNFSASCFSNEAHRLLFEKTSAQKSVSDSGGYVNISFIEAENSEEEMEKYPEQVLGIIRQLEQEKIPLQDVCILTRRKKESIAIANFLSEHQVPVISAQSLLLGRSPEVNFINAVFRFTLDGTDKNLKLEILEFLLKRHPEIEKRYEFLFLNLQKDEQEFFNTFNQFDIEFQLGRLKDLSLYEAAEYVVRSFSLVKDSNAYVQFYLDFIYESSQKQTSGVFEFLQLWEQKKDDLSIVVPKGEQAVQIMTIHKAKGLEFPVVIYPFVNSKIKDAARESLWVNLPETLGSEIPVAYLQASEKMLNWGGEAAEKYEELCFNSQLDALNVLYVALTRPVQQLYVVSKLDLDTKGQESNNSFSGLLISYLKSVGKWDGSLEYEFGERSGYISGEKQDVVSLRQEKFYSSATEGNGISIVTRAGMLWDSRQEKALEKGQLLHDLFAKINTKEDVEGVLNEARENGQFTRKAEEEVRRSILKVVSHPELKEYFSGGSQNMNEQNIITATGEILRPDRLNIAGKVATVIDYKTGSPNQKYKEQIDNYASTLQGMGYEIEKKVLIYINEDVQVSLV